MKKLKLIEIIYKEREKEINLKNWNNRIKSKGIELRKIWTRKIIQGNE